MQLLDKDNSWTESDGTWKTPVFDQGSGGDNPVVAVSWWDARSFCEYLTFTEQSSGVLPVGWKYRLPTDQEWSVAAGLKHEHGNTPKEKSAKIIDYYPWGKNRPPPVRPVNQSRTNFNTVCSPLTKDCGEAL